MCLHQVVSQRHVVLRIVVAVRATVEVVHLVLRLQVTPQLELIERTPIAYKTVVSTPSVFSVILSHRPSSTTAHLHLRLPLFRLSYLVLHRLWPPYWFWSLWLRDDIDHFECIDESRRLTLLHHLRHFQWQRFEVLLDVFHLSQRILHVLFYNVRVHLRMLPLL
jgi:hypothetical protein